MENIIGSDHIVADNVGVLMVWVVFFTHVNIINNNEYTCYD